MRMPGEFGPEDTPEWDEGHDGYAAETKRVVEIRSNDRAVLDVVSSETGLRFMAEAATNVVLIHGAPHTLEILEALHAVVAESLARERKLRQG